MKKTKKFLSLVIVMIIFLTSTIMLSPTNLVQAYSQGYDGMGPVVISGGKRDFRWPVPNYYNIQSCFYDHRNHCAIDIAAPVNTPAVASYSGTVIEAVDGGTSYYGDDGFGNYVVLQHSYNSANGTIVLYTRYSHLNSVTVKKGATVSAGTTIGKIGTTGSSEGYHLDFQILYGNWKPYQTYSIDPYSNQLLELPSNVSVYDSWDCGKSYYALVKELYSKPVNNPQPTKIIYPTSGATYKIASGVGNNMYMDYALSNDNVQIFEDGDSNSDPSWVKSQYFKLTHVGDGWYTIVNVGNGKAVDVYNASSSAGTNVWQYELNKSDAQLFRFYDAGNGYCYIKSKLGCYVDVQNGDNVNRANVWTYTFNGTNAQKWKLVKKDVPNTHKHSYTSTITTNPTCKTDGIRTYKCSCGDSYTQNIGKHPATHVGGTEIRNARASTCKDTGYTGDTYCKGCGVCLGFGTSIAKNYNNHTGGTTINNAKTATCTSEGYTGDTYCKGCNTKLSSGKAIAKNPHNSNITIPAVSATCTETGLSEGKKCSVCGTVTVVQQTVGKKAHSYTSSVTTQPTCTKDGVRTYKCSCGASYIETIAKYGHNSNTTIPAVSATCTKTGLTDGKKCSVCGTITVTQQTVATVSHVDNDGDYKCDYNCGYEFENFSPDDTNKDCSCMCHKSGLIGIIWKILRFIYKLFKINPVCGCGVNHY